jgi:serine phosphatase RsbU (regulator of sigma subunit)
VASIRTEKSGGSRLLAWGLILTFIPVAVVAVALHTAYRRAASELVIERDRQLTYLSAARLENEFLNFAGVLTALARTPEIYGKNVAEQQAALEQAAPRLRTFDAGVVLLDSFGTVRATLPERPEMLLQDWSGHRFFQELLASSEVAFSDGVHDELNGTFVTTIGVRILNERGEFVGALAGMFDLGKSVASSFYASIVRLRIGQSGTTYVVDANGSILYESNYALVGQVFDRSGLPDGAFEGIGGATRTRDAQGREIVAAYVPIPRTGWTLITEDDWATVTAEMRRYSNILLILLAVGMTVPAVGAALLVRQRQIRTHTLEHQEEARHVTALARQALLPKHLPLLAGWNLSVLCSPTSTACESFYDYMLLPSGDLMLMLGDIADTSAQALAVMATTRAALRSAASHALSPAAALTQGNQLVYPEVPQGKPVSCTYGILDPSTGRFGYASAGPTLSYHLGGAEVHQLDSSGLPLGTQPDAHYQQGEVTIRPGESMVLATGHLVSAASSQGRSLNSSRLKAALEGNANGDFALGAVRKELEGYAANGGQLQEGITFLLLERSEETAGHD